MSLADAELGFAEGSTSILLIPDRFGALVGQGKSVIVASHDPAICGVGSYNRVFKLRDGRLAC